VFELGVSDGLRDLAVGDEVFVLTWLQSGAARCACGAPARRLYDETIRQAADDGTPFVEVLEKSGVIPGIKVDTGAKPLAFFPSETVTEGLDGLRERLEEYRELGARFAKWRAALFVGSELPTDFALEANAHAMARYAALCQEAEIVPIVEPEVLIDGDHHIDACEAATGRSLDALYAELAAHRVDLPGTLLKVNNGALREGMPGSGLPGEVAKTTLRTLRAHVPAEVPGWCSCPVECRSRTRRSA
jgi:fructose-bisphosphate aldolase, class I